MEIKKFCECVNKYRDNLYLMALAILKNETDAEEAVGNAILKAYENLEQIRMFHKFKPWILTITKNEALKIKRKKLKLSENEEVETLQEPVQVQYDKLWDVLQQMEEEYRLVAVLFYYEELSLRDISDVLNIPVGTVKSRLNRGRTKIKDALEEVWE